MKVNKQFSRFSKIICFLFHTNTEKLYLQTVNLIESHYLIKNSNYNKQHQQQKYLIPRRNSSPDTRKREREREQLVRL